MSENIKMEPISGYILIHKNGNNHIVIQSNSEFFNQELVIKFSHDHILFKVPELSDRKTWKFRKQKNSKWFQITIAGEKESGKFFFDEDSNSDAVIVYCN